jgi:photosystem II stability/assembly factor-like uncharacterized protein
MYLRAMRITMFVTLFCVGLSAHGQQLFRQNSGTAETLFTISMMDDSSGIAAGSHQAFALTANGGALWHAAQLFGPENYYCSYFNDTSSGAIGGSNGIVLCKRPQEAYSKITLPEHKSVRGVTFPTSDTVGNPHDILAVGDTGLIYRSTDSGRNWTKIAPPQQTANRNFYGVTYWDDSTWWIVGAGGIILYTEDAGTNWQRIQSGTQKDLYSIAFPYDGTNGWIVGDQTMLYSTDGGDAWLPISTTATLRHVDGYDSTGFAVGDNGVLLATNDLIHWQPIETGTTANLYGIAITDNLYIVGDTGIILTTFEPEKNSVAELNHSEANVAVSCDGHNLSVNRSPDEPIDIRIYDLLGIERDHVEVMGGRATLHGPLEPGAYLYRTSLGTSGKFIVQ